MESTAHLTHRTDTTFKLVCANTVMLAILFAGLLLVVWQALALVATLQDDLARAEQSVAALRERVQGMDSEVVIERAVEAAVASVQEQLAASIPDSEALQALSGVPQQLDATAGAIQAISHKVENLDAEQLARQVSYQMLQGLGDGFSAAAESRKP